MEAYSHPLYSCRKCRTPVALAEDLLSKSFVATSGQAFMFSQATNIVLGKSYDKQMLTGNFTIADVYCNTCGQELGWKYVKAHENTQTWKVGKFIIEKAKIVKEYCIKATIKSSFHSHGSLLITTLLIISLLIITVFLCIISSMYFFPFRIL